MERLISLRLRLLFSSRVNKVTTKKANVSVRHYVESKKVPLNNNQQIAPGANLRSLRPQSFYTTGPLCDHN